MAKLEDLYNTLSYIGGETPSGPDDEWPEGTADYIMNPNQSIPSNRFITSKEIKTGSESYKESQSKKNFYFLCCRRGRRT